MLRTLVLALLVVSGAAEAQFPAKPIRVVVPFPAGSATDTITRVLAQSVSQSIGQTVVVENKAGADGAIAAAEVAKAAPDGHTLLMATNSPMSAVPAMKKNPPYDPVADFTPITDVGRYTFFIVVHPSVPAKTLKELIDHARANPGKVNYATGNTTGIVSTAFFASLAKIDLVHVPYKGAAPSIVDAMGGQVSSVILDVTPLLPHIRAGKLRAIGIAGDKRVQVLPDVATLAEQGFKNVEAANWYAILAPAKTPRELVDRLSQAIQTAMKMPDVRDKLLATGADPVAGTPEQLAALLKRDYDKWGKLIREKNITAE